MKLIPELQSEELGSTVIQIAGRRIKDDGDLGFCADALALRRAQLSDAATYLTAVLKRLDLEEEQNINRLYPRDPHDFPCRAMRNELRSFLKSICAGV